MKGDKVIRDSVHGEIRLSEAFVKNIIDTPSFQRLRRIEQTSIRAVFPCARHDRFTHSLGVFHIGTKIVKQLMPQLKGLNVVSEHEIGTIVQSYLIACLLHDIAHAPFSHTFEPYYGDREVLYGRLCDVLRKDLQLDIKKINNIKEHEYASAILSVEKFGEAITSHPLNGDVELVSRMIIGAEYKDKDKFHQLCDCFTNLLHGEVDADRLDYACRDIWASGYKRISVDVNRIIRAMYIKEHKRVLQLCFDYHAVGDIRNIMELKWFQVTHIFNHHTIVYDQALLIHAAEQMAQSIFQEPDLDPAVALSRIISIDAVSKSIILPDDHRIQFLCDDDLFSLMKRSNNTYFNEWYSRQYTHFALWKTPEEFFHLFPNISKSIIVSHPDFKEQISAALDGVLDISKIITHKVEYTSKKSLEDLSVVINEELKAYKDICHEIFKDNVKKKSFKFIYLYLPKPADMNDMEELREQILERITPVIENMFLPLAEGQEEQQEEN